MAKGVVIPNSVVIGEREVAPTRVFSLHQGITIPIAMEIMKCTDRDGCNGCHVYEPNGNLIRVIELVGKECKQLNTTS